jgi:hypothetical protein
MGKNNKKKGATQANPNDPESLKVKEIKIHQPTP